jgi:hypothetical protein
MFLYLPASFGMPAFLFFHFIDALTGLEIHMTQVQIAVACRNASGMADMPVFAVAVTPEEYHLGLHYDKAEALADAAGSEGPFVCFDPCEQPAILSAARALKLTPQVVVVDLTGGLVRSIRCDSGAVQVVCYDEEETDEYSAAVGDHPVGENGEILRCWFHRQTADPDPGLRKLLD